MKKFKVYAKTVEFPSIIIEAENEQEAREKAEEIDGGEFEPDIYGSWEISEAIEI